MRFDGHIVEVRAIDARVVTDPRGHRLFGGRVKPGPRDPDQSAARADHDLIDAVTAFAVLAIDERHLLGRIGPGVGVDEKIAPDGQLDIAVIRAAARRGFGDDFVLRVENDDGSADTDETAPARPGGHTRLARCGGDDRRVAPGFDHCIGHIGNRARLGDAHLIDPGDTGVDADRTRHGEMGQALGRHGFDRHVASGENIGLFDPGPGFLFDLEELVMRPDPGRRAERGGDRDRLDLGRVAREHVDVARAGHIGTTRDLGHHAVGHEQDWNLGGHGHAGRGGACHGQSVELGRVVRDHRDAVIGLCLPVEPDIAAFAAMRADDTIVRRAVLGDDEAAVGNGRCDDGRAVDHGDRNADGRRIADGDIQRRLVEGPVEGFVAAADRIDPTAVQRLDKHVARLHLRIRNQC